MNLTPYCSSFFCSVSDHFLVDLGAIVHDLVHLAGIDDVPQGALDESRQRFLLDSTLQVDNAPGHPLDMYKEAIHPS